jgi:hypothetical protein
MSNSIPPCRPRRLAQLQNAFVTVILPRVQYYGRIAFRHLDADRREEATAEMTAICWLWFMRLAARGKDATHFPSVLASLAARAVRAGRRLCGKGHPKEAMSRLTQQRHGFFVQTLPHEDTCRDDNPVIEALHDNTRSTVPYQVAFRLDFPAWFQTYPEHKRRIMHDLMVGERTRDVSRKYGLSAGRISQLRREFKEDWSRFQGVTLTLSDPPPAAA